MPAPQENSLHGIRPVGSSDRAVSDLRTAFHGETLGPQEAVDICAAFHRGGSVCLGAVGICTGMATLQPEVLTFLGRAGRPAWA